MPVLTERELVGIYNMVKNLNEQVGDGYNASEVSFRVKVYDQLGENVGTIHQDEGDYMFDTDQKED